MELVGKTAFISGGGGGIAKGLAEAFIGQGMGVVLADLDEDAANITAELFGDSAVALPLDVTSLQSWEDAYHEATARFGAIDVLCNNAGVAIDWEPIVDTAPEDFDRAVKVNLYGVYNGVKVFGPRMIARRSGHIVNVCSFNGLVSMGTMGGYSASKFGVTALSAALRQEMAGHEIGVSTVYPGATRSRMTAELSERYADRMRSHVFMEPLRVGQAVVAAIRANAPHVISHPDLKPAYDAWIAEVSRAFDAPADPIGRSKAEYPQETTAAHHSGGHDA